MLKKFELQFKKEYDALHEIAPEIIKKEDF